MPNPLLIGTPVLMPINAGRGETPPCPEAKFKAGDVVKVRRKAWLRHKPETAAVAAVVPPGFPPQYVLADLAGEARPLMHTRPRRAINYICLFEGDLGPFLIPERDLMPSGLPPVGVGIVDRR